MSKITINSELELYRKTGNSTHARWIADRLLFARESGLDAFFQMVPDSGRNTGGVLSDNYGSVAHDEGAALPLMQPRSPGKSSVFGFKKKLLVEVMYSGSKDCVCCAGQHRFATVLKDGSEIFDHAGMIQSFISNLPSGSEVRIDLSCTRPMPGAVVDRDFLVGDKFGGGL